MPKYHLSQQKASQFIVEIVSRRDEDTSFLDLFFLVFIYYLIKKKYDPGEIRTPDLTISRPIPFLAKKGSRFAPKEASSKRVFLGWRPSSRKCFALWAHFSVRWNRVLKRREPYQSCALTRLSHRVFFRFANSRSFDQGTKYSAKLLSAKA